MTTLLTITVAEASRATGIPVKSIRKLLEDGKLAGNRVGKNWRVSVQSLGEWVNHTPHAPAVTETRHFPEVEDRFQ